MENDLNGKGFTTDGLKNNIESLSNSFGKETPPGEQIPRLADYDHLRVTMEKHIPIQRPTVRFGNGGFAAPKNISGIGAPPKHFKTAITNVIIAGAISKDGNIDGLDNIEVETNPKCKAVLNFDSEQAEEDHQHNVKTVCFRAGFDKTPDYYRAYNIRQLNLSDYQGYTSKICELCSNQFGGIHLIVIDGGADYIQSVNDEREANAILHYFTQLAIKYDCAVIIVVHTNPSQRGEETKERGHFGSALQRKCYGLATITKNGDVFTLQPKMLRKASLEDTPLIHFKYNKEKGYPVSVDQPDANETKNLKEVEKWRKIADVVFPLLALLRNKDAVSAIMKNGNCSLSTAKTMLKNMEGIGFVSKDDDGNYSRITD